MTPYDSAREVFPPFGCWERYETRGFQERAFIRGVTEASYNTTALWLNRIRHQPGATSATTLRVGAEREGRQVRACLERTTSEILKHEGCDDTGRPLDPSSLRPNGPMVMSAEFVAEAIAACHLTADERAEVERNPVPYEQPTATVNVSIDDVVVKQQKQHRATLHQEPDIVEHEETNSGRKYVHDTIAHIQHQEHSYGFAGPSVPAVLRILLGYLLTNVLVGCRLQFFVDGQKTLQAAIFKAFAWLSHIDMILDWYHLEDKCARQLSLAMKGAALRNEALAELRNLGEKMNDLLVSDRQKHHGMSWSAGGSMALAALEPLQRNNEYQHWFEFHEIELKQAA